VGEGLANFQVVAVAFEAVDALVRQAGHSAGAVGVGGEDRRGVDYPGFTPETNVCDVAKDKDPEQLLSEALRAHAVNAGPPASPGFGLLSGSDLGMASRAETLAEEPVGIVVPRRRLHGGVILLLALVLGLAAGAVAGLATVL
jgi:hypothetical protein